MSCLNSNSLRLKNLIYWKNFYYINNYNSGYLIYNDFNFFYFLETLFTLKISNKFQINEYLFKSGFFFTHMKINKIDNNLVLLLFFNKIGNFTLQNFEFKEISYNYFFLEKKVKVYLKKICIRLFLIKLFFFKFLLKKKIFIKKKKLLNFKLNFVNNQFLKRFTKYYSIVFSKSKIIKVINKKIFSKKNKYFFYKNKYFYKKKYFIKKDYPLKDFFLDLKKVFNIKSSWENLIFKKKYFLGLQIETNPNKKNYFKNKYYLNLEKNRVILKNIFNYKKISRYYPDFFVEYFFQYGPFFSFLKRFFIQIYLKYFWKLNTPNFNIYIIIRKKRNSTANSFMYLILGKLRKYYKLPKILYIFNNICDFYVETKQIRGYKIVCMGRFSRKDRAAYRWYQFYIAQNTKFRPVEFSWRNIILKYSSCIIKIWICK